MKSQWFFPRYLLRAKALLAAGRLPELLHAVSKKGERQVSRLGSAKDDLLLLMRLAATWWKGEYRAISTQALLGTVAALLYFVAPIDAVPDWLLGAGFVDDIAVLAMVFRRWNIELEQFREWLQSKPAHEVASLEQLAE